MSNTLLPCPFCGGEVEIDMLDSENSRNVKIYSAVHCPECHQWFFKGLSKEKTVAAWNRRSNAIPVVRGGWTTNSNYPDTVICSLCGWRESVWWADKGTNYCPNCGAKMEGKQKDE